MGVEKIRPAAVAGQFYPGIKGELLIQVNAFLKRARSFKIKGKLRALIVPHAGYAFSGPMAALGFRLAQEQWDSGKTVFLLGSSHHYPLQEPVGADFNFWQTPLGKVPAKKPSHWQIFNQAHLNEHCLEVQLPFLQVGLKDFKIIPLLLNHYQESEAKKLGDLIKEKEVILVSSDLSHYHSYQEANQMDKTANQAIPKLDFKTVRDKVEACGLGAILTLIKIARLKNWRGRLLGYQNSGDTFGDKGQVVGYASYGFFE